MSWYDSILDTGTKVFSWMEDNPTASSFIGGAAASGLSYYSGRQQAKDRRDEVQDDRRYREQFGGASNTDAGKTPNQLVGGTNSLTNGSMAEMAAKVGNNG